MNVYDFDKTIFDGDSTAHFVGYCLLRYPGTWLTLPGAAAKFIAYKTGRCTLTQFKEQMYSFLRHIPDIDGAVSDFWDKHRSRIKGWYLRQKSDDIIISASPEFLLEPICAQLGVRLIASRVDKHTGEYTGENCRDEEKVRRLDAQYPGTVIDRFYSDSYADTPLAKLAKQAFMVDGDRVFAWKWKE